MHPHSTLNEGLVRINGTTAGQFAFDTIVPEYPYAILMPQPIFLQALVDKAAPFPSFQCWIGASGMESDRGRWHDRGGARYAPWQGTV